MRDHNITKNEARRIAANIAKLPDLLPQPLETVLVRERRARARLRRLIEERA